MGNYVSRASASQRGAEVQRGEGNIQSSTDVFKVSERADIIVRNHHQQHHPRVLIIRARVQSGSVERAVAACYDISVDNKVPITLTIFLIYYPHRCFIVLVNLHSQPIGLFFFLNKSQQTFDTLETPRRPPKVKKFNQVLSTFFDFRSLKQVLHVRLIRDDGLGLSIVLDL